MSGERNPYTPPSANIEVAQARRGSAVKAVLLGLATDIGGTMVFSTLAAILYGIYLAGRGTAPDKIAPAMSDIPYDSPMGIVMAIVGCLFSVLGGYVCARTARHSEYRLGFVMFAASMVLLMFGGTGETHAIVTAALILATLASIMAGIHIGVRKTRSGR